MKIQGVNVSGKLIFNVILGIGIIVFAKNGFVMVGPGQRGVMLDWGAVQPGILMPGLHFKMPFRQSVRTLSVRVQNVASKETASSMDLQDVTTKVAVNFNLVPAMVGKTYQEIGTLDAVYGRVLAPAISNAVKAVTAKFKASSLVVHRDLVRSQIEQQIRQSVKGYGIRIDAVNITDFNFSPIYDRAIERKQVAQQRSLQAKYELQRARIDAQKKVVNAQANAQASIETAKGEAESEVISAKADARAMMLRRKVLTDKLLELDWINRWDGKLPLMQNGAKPLVNLSGMLGQK